MTVNLVAFGIAKDILQAKHLKFDLAAGDTILTLKQKLFAQYPEFSKLKSLSFAVGENYQEDAHTLKENDEIIIIPPVSGG